ERRADYRAEGITWAVVVPVDAHPVDILPARPPLTNGGIQPGLRGVDRPQPRNVGRPHRTEYVNYMAPGGDEIGRRCVSISPRIPVAIHLVPEGDDNRVAERFHVLGIGTEPGVSVAGRDLANALL